MYIETHMLGICKVSCCFETILHTYLVLCVEICWGVGLGCVGFQFFYQNNCSNSTPNVPVIVLIITMT